MKRYLSYYFKVLRISLMNEMTDRVNFLTWSLVHTASLLTFVLLFGIIFSKIQAINGWTHYQVLLVLGIGDLITGLGSMTFFSFMYSHPKEVSNGEFDFKLVRPMDAQFLASFASVDMDDAVVTFEGLILCGYSLSKLVGFSLINIFPAIILLICSMVILYSFLTLLVSLSFKHIAMDALMDFYWSVVNVTKNPVKAIKNSSVLVSLILVPIGLISSVPAEVLFGRWEWSWMFGSVVVAIAMLIFSRIIWQKSLKDYSSASS